MNRQKIFNYLGLAQISGKITSGENTLLAKGHFDRYSLIIIAENASEMTKKRFSEKANQSNTSYIIFGDKAELGRAIGKSPRSILAITDKKIVKMIMELAGGEVTV